MQISKRIAVEGFDTIKEFEKWLDEQEKEETNKHILKSFKYFLMQTEEDVHKDKCNKKHCEDLNKYAIKVIKRKIMSEESVIKFIRQAQNIE